MRNPKDFFRPLALGAPDPVREIPVRPTRMIHFFNPASEKMVAKLPDMIGQADVLLGNLEDAIQADQKEAARAGLVKVGREIDFGDTQLWTRVEQPRFAVGARRHHHARHRDRRQARRDHDSEGRRARGHPLRRSTVGAARSRGRTSIDRCSCTPCSRRRAAWPTSRRSAARARACKVCRSVRPISPPTGA